MKWFPVAACVVHPFFTRFLLALCLLVCITSENNLAQDELDVLKTSGETWLQYTDVKNSLYHYLAGQSFNLLDERKRMVTRIQTLPGWQERQQQVSKILMDIVGPFPERTALNTKIIRTIEKGGYRVEHIVFESQPGFYVTSSLFIPALQGRKKAPAVIYCSGHSEEGYRSKVYQHIILNLVKKGFIVFAFDPVGQGERMQYPDPETGKSAIGGPTSEHSYAGAQAFITGSSYARYMIWDGIRAIDYLISRKEVDTARIGITGRSGGGTQSAYIAACDERIYASAPECYITSFTRLLQSIGPQDAEQNLFHGIASGIDHADLLSVRAPKPAMLIATTHDFFSIQGARETADEIRGIYKAYGSEQNFTMVEDDAPHESTRRNREAMYAFFQHNLNNPGTPVDQEVELLKEDEIRVTGTGQTLTTYGGETVFSLNQKEAEKLVVKLTASSQNLPAHLDGIVPFARNLSGYREPNDTFTPVFTGRLRREAYVVEKYFMQGESDYVIPYLLMVPDNPNHKGLLYLHPEGKSANASPGGEIEKLVREGFTVLAPDLIGVGETGPGDFQGDAYINGISYNIWFASILIGRSIVGIQAGDAVRLARQLEKHVSCSGVFGLAIRQMAPILLHAAAFDPVITRIVLIEPYSSYRSMVMSQFYNTDFIHSTVPGSLMAYDLPDLSASLAPRKLMIAGITDCLGNVIIPDSIPEDINIIKAAYNYRNAIDQLQIIPGKANWKTDYPVMDWGK
jgi:cephalosporin-C deacetylase-like acetyl esterase